MHLPLCTRPTPTLIDFVLVPCFGTHPFHLLSLTGLRATRLIPSSFPLTPSPPPPPLGLTDSHRYCHALPHGMSLTIYVPSRLLFPVRVTATELHDRVVTGLMRSSCLPDAHRVRPNAGSGTDIDNGGVRTEVLDSPIHARSLAIVLPHVRHQQCDCDQEVCDFVSFIPLLLVSGRAGNVTLATV